MKAKYIVSVDWLELFCKKTILFESAVEKGVRMDDLQVIEQEYGNRYFSKKYIIIEHGIDVASFLSEPRARFIDPACVILKLNNRILYTREPMKYARALCDRLGLDIHGITRLDLAYDCQRFKSDYRPHKFIKDYVTLSAEDGRFIHRYGSNEFCLYGGRQKGNGSRFSYIRFGSKKSAVTCYIYNKSKELRDAIKQSESEKANGMWKGEHKPWIWDCWRSAEFNTDKEDIWRCEISIRSAGTSFLCKESQKIMQLLPDSSIWEYGIQSVFKAYAKRYMRFGICTGQAHAKDYTPLELFDIEGEIPVRPIAICESLDNGRTEKLVAKKLEEYSVRYGNLAENYRKSLYDTIEFFYTISRGKECEYGEMRTLRALDRFLCFEHLRTFEKEDRYKPHGLLASLK